MICASQCYSGSSYACHFAYSYSSQKNYIEYLSVSSCSFVTVGNNSVRLRTGEQKVENTNSSLNNEYSVSSIVMESSSQRSCLYCTFSNNIASNNRCICFWDNTGIISFSNIVHNNSPLKHGVVYVSGSYKIHYCIFKMNQDTLFYVESGSIDVSH